MALRTQISPALQALLCCAALTTGGACFARAPTLAQMDKDLLEVTVSQLQDFYAQHKYTVTQVLDWHLARIHRYDGIYRSIETLMESGARTDAAREDADAARGSAQRGLLWGVPIVIKANTSIE